MLRYLDLPLVSQLENSESHKRTTFTTRNYNVFLHCKQLQKKCISLEKCKNVMNFVSHVQHQYIRQAASR